MIRGILITVLALLLFYVGSHRRASVLQLIFLSMFFIGGGFLVLRPDAANLIAASVGVGRGADLLLYFSVLAGIYVSAAFYIRFRDNETAMIAIVRELAIAKPIQEENSSQAAPGN